jgi:8-oxo-dGTP pyrophosphatase MutT (NUDIX family)
MSQWKITSEKTVLNTPLFDVKKLEIVLPTGSKRTHYVAERLPIVCILPLTDDYEVYLISQYRYLLGKTIVEAVAGHVEKDETPLFAAKRELKEETGIIATQWEELTRVETGASAFRSKVHIYLAKGLELGKPEPMEDEEIALNKMPLKEAAQMVENGKINHSTTMLGILLLDRLKREKKL